MTFFFVQVGSASNNARRLIGAEIPLVLTSEKLGGIHLQVSEETEG